jgi:hypothetical protein
MQAYHQYGVGSFLIFKCNMSHGTVKYTLKAHAYYFVFMASLLHYLWKFTRVKINDLFHMW